MNNKTTPILLAVPIVLLAGASFFFYQSGSSEHRIRLQKEHDLTQKIDDLANMEAQIAELNKTLAGFRDTSQKKINALEMSAREREETSQSLKSELDSLKKEKDEALARVAEKDSALTDLADRLASLQHEKEELSKKVDALKDELKSAQDHAQTSDAAPKAEAETLPSNQPFGMMPDRDLGTKIDPVNLGEIVVSKASGRAARVQEVNPVYDFIIIDAGEKDGIREGAVMNIVRHNTLIGKAVIRQTRPGASAALVLPEWKKAPVEKGDLITKF